MRSKNFWTWFAACLAVVSAFHLYEVNTFDSSLLQSSVSSIQGEETPEGEYETAPAVLVADIGDSVEVSNEWVVATPEQLVLLHGDDDPCVAPDNLAASDNDNDGIWDEGACDNDDDNDDVLDVEDNCPLVWNPEQGEDC